MGRCHVQAAMRACIRKGVAVWGIHAQMRMRVEVLDNVTVLPFRCALELCCEGHSASRREPVAAHCGGQQDCSPLPTAGQPAGVRTTSPPTECCLPSAQDCGQEGFVRNAAMGAGASGRYLRVV